MERRGEAWRRGRRQKREDELWTTVPRMGHQGPDGTPRAEIVPLMESGGHPREEPSGERKHEENESENGGRNVKGGVASGMAR